MSSYYGDLSSANSYFANKLHSESWSDSTPSDRPKALLEATRIIDNLRYKGVKHSVWEVMYEWNSSKEKYEKILSNPPTRNEIISADAEQELEFPRGQDTEVPQEIKWACYEIAFALIEGFDPEDAADRLNIVRQSYSSVKTTYDNSSEAMEYLAYGIPTMRVWNLLKPYLSGVNPINISRAD